MAYASKSEQRAQLAKSYSGGSGTLTSDSYRKTGNMGDKGKPLVGKTMSGPGSPKLYGKTISGESSGIFGEMKGSGFSGSGKQGKAASVPSRSAKGTTTMTPGEKHGGFKQKNTGSTPKVLRGGKGY